MRLSATTNKAVLAATTGHRPIKHGQCLCGETKWTKQHLAQHIQAAAGQPVTITDHEWEIEDG